jgi:hypothetical protein
MKVWRIPAAIALVLCAVASRLALGAAVPLTLPDGADALSRLEAAMVICTPDGAHRPSVPPRPSPRTPSFDDQLLLDIAETAAALPPLGVALPSVPLTLMPAAEAGPWLFITLSQPRGTRPAPRAPPQPV